MSLPKKYKKIGLYGGTFDPVHKAHIDIAMAAISQHHLDEVWFLIEKNPRYKVTETTYQHRLEMMRLATDKYPKLIADRYWIQQQGQTHDITTLLDFKKQFPGYEFTLVMGSDVIPYVATWKDFAVFCQHADFAVVPRGTRSIEILDVTIKSIINSFQNFKCTIIDFPLSAISSNDIRRHLCQSRNCDAVENNILSYIKNHHLYKT